MAKANLVSRKIEISKKGIIKYQLITYCFINDIKLSNNELDCLTLLGLQGEYELSVFCTLAVDEKIFKTSQTVRNFLTRAYKHGLVKKKGTNKKTVNLSETLELQTEGNIILDIKMYYVTKEQ